MGAVEAISGNKGIAMSVILVTLCLFSVMSVSAVQVSENVEFQTPGTSTTFVMGSDFTFDTIEVHSTKLMLDNAAISVHPSVGSITFTLYDFSTDYKKWSEECSNPAATTTHMLGGLKTNTPYRVIVSGAPYGPYTSNNSGYVSFTYSGGDSDAVFEMKEADTETTTRKSPQITISHTTLVLPEVGEETLITVSLENTGTGDAKNIKLRERIPSGLSIDYVEGADSTGNLVSWDGDLKPAQTHSVKHSLKVLTAEKKIIEATVTYEDITGEEDTTSTTIVLEVEPKTPTAAPTPTVAPTPTPTPPSTFEIPEDESLIILIAVVLGGIAIIIAIIVGRRGGDGRTEVTIEEKRE